jgi:hypothetical protein
MTLFLAVLLAGIPAGASSIVDLTEIGVGARPLGMGRAFNAIANDGSAIFANPAGLTSVKTYSLISMSGNLINEVPYLTVGGAWNNGDEVWGLGYVAASVDGINETILVNGTPEVTGNQASFGSSLIVISYANDARRIPPFNSIKYLTDRDAKVGISLKVPAQGFTGAPSFEGGTGSGFDLDIGTIIPINDNLSSSFTVRNLIPGNNIKNDEMPLVVVGGFALKNRDKNLLTAVDAEINNGAFLLHLGSEWNPKPALFLRAGLDQSTEGYNLAFGVGTKMRGFSFDYAYHTYAELSEFTTHYFSIGYIGQE